MWVLLANLWLEYGPARAATSALRRQARRGARRAESSARGGGSKRAGSRGVAAARPAAQRERAGKGGAGGMSGSGGSLGGIGGGVSSGFVAGGRRWEDLRKDALRVESEMGHRVTADSKIGALNVIVCLSPPPHAVPPPPHSVPPPPHSVPPPPHPVPPPHQAGGLLQAGRRLRLSPLSLRPPPPPPPTTPPTFPCPTPPLQARRVESEVDHRLAAYSKLGAAFALASSSTAAGSLPDPSEAQVRPLRGAGASESARPPWGAGRSPASSVPPPSPTSPRLASSSTTAGLPRDLFEAQDGALLPLHHPALLRILESHPPPSPRLLLLLILLLLLLLLLRCLLAARPFRGSGGCAASSSPPSSPTPPHLAFHRCRLPSAPLEASRRPL
ncbi:unnamed protein product [Closterium sp. Naga37s-1]|nr:unnamed protein product [Closterium sp. Naga37s-1]